MANQQNEKIIKDFEDCPKSTRHQLHKFVKAMCVEDRGGEVEAILLGKDMTPCVAREWGNAHLMRKSMLNRAFLRKYRKETSAFGKRGQYGRRIIKSLVRAGRTVEFHATKGLRSYMLAKEAAGLQ